MRYKKAKKADADTEKLIRKFLTKAVIKTTVSAMIVASFLFLGNYLESVMDWAGILLQIVAVGAWLACEYLNWVFPTSVYDGFLSFIKLARYFIAYTRFKNEQTYYVKTNLIERIREKWKKEENDD